MLKGEQSERIISIYLLKKVVSHLLVGGLFLFTKEEVNEYYISCYEVKTV